MESHMAAKKAKKAKAKTKAKAVPKKAKTKTPKTKIVAQRPAAKRAKTKKAKHAVGTAPPSPKKDEVIAAPQPMTAATIVEAVKNFASDLLTGTAGTTKKTP
jgi:hypothetical protein